MDLRNEGTAREQRRPPTTPMSSRQSPPPLAVAQRRQTPEEQRRFNAAFELFLAEMVRLRLDREDKQ